jgi:hypothetical protein
MSLVHYVRPFLELGICKEYSMARKTTGTTTTTRSKKAVTTVPPVIEQVAAPAQKLVQKEAQRSLLKTLVPRFARTGQKKSARTGKQRTSLPPRFPQQMSQRSKNRSAVAPMNSILSAEQPQAWQMGLAMVTKIRTG